MIKTRGCNFSSGASSGYYECKKIIEQGYITTNMTKELALFYKNYNNNDFNQVSRFAILGTGSMKHFVNSQNMDTSE